MPNHAMAQVLASVQGYRRHTIGLLVHNRPGVLIRIALVFARRGYNLDSLVVSASSDPKFSMMTIVASGEEKTLDQIIKQLNKLIDVVHATDRTGEEIIQRELALVKIACTNEERAQLLQLAHVLRAESVDLDEAGVTFQVTGTSEHIDGVVRVFADYDVIELIRTGKVLMARGRQATA